MNSSNHFTNRLNDLKSRKNKKRSGENNPTIIVPTSYDALTSSISSDDNIIHFGVPED